MNIHYEWTISAMDCEVKVGSLENIVSIVHWRLNASTDNHTAETYGCTIMKEPSGLDFTPYENLTKLQIVSWLESILTVVPDPIDEVVQESQLDKIKNNLSNNLLLKKNPVKVYLPLPFND